MSGQIKVVAWLHILLGVLSLLGGIFISVIAGAVSAVVASGTTGHSTPGVLAFMSVGTIAFVLIAIFAIPHFIVGWGLLRGTEWARIAGIVLSILSLFHPALGLGTAIAVYSLVVLASGETAEAMRRTA